MPIRYTCLCLCLMLLAPRLQAQRSEADSLLQALTVAKDDTQRIKTYWSLSYYYQNSKPDTALLLARKALLMAQRMGYSHGVSWSLNQMAGALMAIGNYNKALQYYLDQLKIEEKVNKPYNLAIVNLNIANVYNKQQDFLKALPYAKRADSIIGKNKLESLPAESQMNIGDLYEKMNQLDSALIHTIRANTLALKEREDLIGATMSNLGNVYLKMQFDDVAKDKYHQALPFLLKYNDYTFMCEAYLGLANIYEKEKQYDSALHYGRQALELSSTAGFLEKSLLANSFLANLYRKMGKADSAYQHLNNSILLKDSIFSKDKVRLSKEMEINEEIRQTELADTRAKEERERKASMQWLGIGIFIPLFILLTIYMSRKRVKVRIIKTAGIISLLLLFEYITLLLHPKILKLSHHIPVIEVIIFVAIAAILTPTHHRIEHMLTQWLTQHYGLEGPPDPQLSPPLQQATKDTKEKQADDDQPA